jgi:hypothetical protein
MTKSRNRFPHHPLTEIFPLMPDAKIADLAASIEAVGQNTPIRTIDEGDGEQIVTGRALYDACLRLGADPWIERLSDNFAGDLLRLIVDSNIQRQNWTYGQRARMAALAVTTHWGGTRNFKRGSSPLGGNPKLTQAEAAAMFEITVDALKQATFIHEQAPNDLDRLIEAGTPWVTLNGVFSLACLPEEKRRAIVNQDLYKFELRRIRDQQAVQQQARPAKTTRPITDRAIKDLTPIQADVIVGKLAPRATNSGKLAAAIKFFLELNNDQVDEFLGNDAVSGKIESAFRRRARKNDDR